MISSIANRVRIPAYVRPDPLKVVSSLAAAAGMLGSYMVADPSYVRWGFVLFFVSNVGWIAFCIKKRLVAMLIQQLFFMATSSMGIWNWWVMGK